MSLIERIKDETQPPIVVAELSGNHRQDFDVAKNVIHKAAQVGADAIKLQTYTANSLTLDCKSEEFVVQDGLWKGQSLYELYTKASTPYEWHKPLKDLADDLGITLFSTPFDEAAVDFLENEIDPQLYKISSFEITHIPLLERVAETGKPVVLSTGMATESEIDEAIKTLRTNGSSDVVLLKCVSAYPSNPNDFNLKSMLTLQERFSCPVGLSDHCLTNEIAIAATALGARLIEKHVTDDRDKGGVDAKFSLETAELRDLVQKTRTTHAALGKSELGTVKQDEEQKKYRRSIYVAKAIKQGKPFTKENIKIIRPSDGLAPKHWKTVLNKTARRDLEMGNPLSKEDIES